MKPRHLATAALILLAATVCAAEAVRAGRAQSPAPSNARPGELLLLLDEAVIRCTAVSYSEKQLTCVPVGSPHGTTFEAGNGYVYNATTRVITGDSRLFASGMEQGR